MTMADVVPVPATILQLHHLFYFMLCPTKVLAFRCCCGVDVQEAQEQCYLYHHCIYYWYDFSGGSLVVLLWCRIGCAHKGIRTGANSGTKAGSLGHP